MDNERTPERRARARQRARARLNVLAVTAGLALASEASAAAQEPGGVLGRWDGAVVVLGQELGMSVTFEAGEEGLAAQIDIPAQGAIGIPLTEVSYEPPRVHFELPAGPGLAVWDGELTADTIAGTFTQAGYEGTFRLVRSDEAPAPHEGEAGAGTDAEPPPYLEEELTFENGEIRLAGTLTIPEGSGRHPAVVLLTGSGPQNRDEELFGFKPFRLIADYLTRRGIAVLRYDDRGVGGSTGNVSDASSEDFARDALAAVETLAARDDIDADAIGLLGHSEGGIVAPLAATRSEAVAFIVLLAGTSVPGSEVIIEQAKLIGRANDADEQSLRVQESFQRRLFAAVREERDTAELEAELEEMTREGIEGLPDEQRAAIKDVDTFVQTQVETQLARIQTPWFRSFLDYDPAVTLRETRVPVLALFGELDLQVAPAQNRGPMEAALSAAGNEDVTIEVIPGANHLFQRAETGSPTEYASLEKAFIPGLLARIADWILERTG